MKSGSHNYEKRFHIYEINDTYDTFTNYSW